MSTPVEFHPLVQDEIDDGFRWYERQRPGLGTDFLDEVQDIVTLIADNPGRFGFADGGDVREAPVNRFPYAFYYRELPDRVRVLAVYHTSRDPAGWQSRT